MENHAQQTRSTIGHQEIRSVLSKTFLALLTCMALTPANSGTLTNVSVTADTYAVGAPATYTFRFTTETQLLPHLPDDSPPVSGDMILFVEFPAGFSKTGADDVAGTACADVTVSIGVSGSACGYSNSWGGGASGYGATYRRWVTGDFVPAGSVVTVTIAGVVNPTSPGQSGPFVIRTAPVSSSNTPYDTPAAAPTVTISAAVESIPTLSEWGMIILSSIMALFAFAHYRRRGN